MPLGKELCLDLSLLRGDDAGLKYFRESIQQETEVVRNSQPSEISHNSRFPDNSMLHHLAHSYASSLHKAVAYQWLPAEIGEIAQAFRQMKELATSKQDVEPISNFYPMALKEHHTTKETEPPISDDRFFQVDFENTLKYVHLPFDTSSVSGKITANQILDWLYECKKVRHIFEVHIEDCQFTPHSEEDIESALNRFDVRLLDWRRADMSIDAALGAAPNVEALYLYSSGNPAVIDHWMGPNGVRRLKRVCYSRDSSRFRLWNILANSKNAESLNACTFLFCL
jgi:hypothetical protein